MDQSLLLVTQGHTPDWACILLTGDTIQSLPFMDASAISDNQTSTAARLPGAPDAPPLPLFNEVGMGFLSMACVQWAMSVTPRKYVATVMLLLDAPGLQVWEVVDICPETCPSAIATLYTCVEMLC